MKSYTDIEESKKLAEILPLKSADMHYIRAYCGCNQSVWFVGLGKLRKSDDVIPSWSLTALLNLCPTINGKQPILTRGKITRLWYCYYEDEMDTQTYDNPIDAVFEMIQLLHEQKLL